MKDRIWTTIVVAGVTLAAAVVLWLEGPRTVENAVLSLVLAVGGMVAAFAPIALVGRMRRRDGSGT
jgi:hypothetical protein